VRAAAENLVLVEQHGIALVRLAHAGVLEGLHRIDQVPLAPEPKARIQAGGGHGIGQCLVRGFDGCIGLLQVDMAAQEPQPACLLDHIASVDRPQAAAPEQVRPGGAQLLQQPHHIVAM